MNSYPNSLAINANKTGEFLTNISSKSSGAFWTGQESSKGDAALGSQEVRTLTNGGTVDAPVKREKLGRSCTTGKAGTQLGAGC